ncbi:MAG TPA: CaiB/BaiF CoA-transferase family protein [Acidimicrobiales bacterium]|nr:CaiB/BaiF CoA-transferase family protein [Acidimicrobiales bacterium]
MRDDHDDPATNDRGDPVARNEGAGAGPLHGFRVIELAGLGPAPYACMLLAEAGADVLRLERAGGAASRKDGASPDLLRRSRPAVGIDLKRPEAVALVLDLVARADVLVEGFRPGVAERLGLGPDDCWARNARLVYGRMTGWGQDGPLAGRAGHDIDYIAVAGALWPIGRVGDAPVPPLNLVGDFGGGGMLLAFGVVTALLETQRSGTGQVVDAAMVDGAASLTTMLHGMWLSGTWQPARGVNLLDTGAPFYEVYEAADGAYVAVGALEPQFYAALLEGLGLSEADVGPQSDRARWPAAKARIAEVFRTRTRDEWASVFEGVDACVAPVLSPWEAADHPYNRARSTFVDHEGRTQPGAVPRFSRTPSGLRTAPGAQAALGRWGVGTDAFAELTSSGVLSGPP